MGAQLKGPSSVLWWPLDVCLSWFLHQGIQPAERKTCLQTHLLHMASCEKRGIGDIQPVAPGLQMSWWGQKIIWKSHTQTYCWILSIAPDNSKHMDSQIGTENKSKRSRLYHINFSLGRNCKKSRFPRSGRGVLTTDHKSLNHQNLRENVFQKRISIHPK